MMDLKSLDALIPYPTAKVARIKDSKLGLLRYALMCIIAFYVVGYQIAWKGSHLETQDLSGVYQLQLDHPTKNNCDSMNVECMQNFTSMSKLDYCSQSPLSASVQLPCEYWDSAQLGQLTDQGLMIPSHVSTFHQTQGCTPSAANKWTCEGWLYDYLDQKGQVQQKRGQASPIKDFFIADVERYTLLIDHSVRSNMGVREYASEMVGYWLDCGDSGEDKCVPRPVPCGHKACKSRSAAHSLAGLDKSHDKSQGDHRRLSLAGVRSAVAHGVRSSVGFVARNVFSKSTLELQEEATEAVVQEKKDISLLQKDPDDPDEDTADNDSDEDTDDNHERKRKREKETNLPGLDEDKTRDADPPDAPKQTTMDSSKQVQGRVDHLESLGVVSLLQGDMFTIGMLLKAANVSLDKRRHHVPAWVGGSYRSSGFVLVIRIHYTNIESWLGMKVLPWKMLGPTMHYTYRITKHASHDDFMLRQVEKASKDEPPHSRVVKEYHGIRVLVEQSGTVAVWNNIQLLLILTTTLALMALTNCITDTVALYCMPQSDEYWSIKYERPRTRKRMRSRTGGADVEAAAETEGEDEEDDRVMHYSSITM